MQRLTSSSNYYPPLPVIDFAARQFLGKRFVPRNGVDRVGRYFSPNDIPADDGRTSERARVSQVLYICGLLVKYANPSDDIFLAENEQGRRVRVRMQWLRLYWQESK